MILTAEEYRRGFVKWQIDAPSTIQTANAVESWSYPLADPTGTLVETNRALGNQIRINCGDVSALSRPFWVRWEWADSDDIHFAHWDDQNDVIENVGVPSFGRFHRLVMATPYLDWDKDSIIRIGDAVLRMRTTGFTEVASSQYEEHHQNKSTFVVELGTERIAGKSIEIIVPATSPEQDPMDGAFAAAGLLALVLGDGAAGQIVTSQGLQCEPDTVGTHVAQELLDVLPLSPPGVLRAPRKIKNEVLPAIEQGLMALFDPIPRDASMLIALRWFEHGIRVRGSADTLLAHYIGIEVIATAFAKERKLQSPLIKIASDVKSRRLLEPLLDSYEQSLVDRLENRVIYPQLSILDRVNFLLNELGIDDDAFAVFTRLYNVRNPMTHGSSVFVTPEDAQDAQKLLATILKRRLAIVE